MYFAAQKIALPIPLFLYIHGNSALQTLPTLLPPHPYTNIADSNLQDQDPSQHPPAPAQLHARNLTLPNSILTGRFDINPSLIIIIDHSYPIPNTTALFQLFIKSSEFADSSIAQYGANATLPGRIIRTEYELQYFIQPPNIRAFNHFTWESYSQVTEWLFWYLYFVGHKFACAFNVRRRLEDGGEEQIGYGEVGMMAGGDDRSSSVSLESLQFNASTGISR